MNRQIGSASDRKRRPRGFTLVELLVVIVIIGILIGLLVPAVGAVRRVAKEASTKATLTAIETGLETFKTDAKLGGLYPPSFSDADPSVTGGLSPRGAVVSPYLLNNSTTTVNITGAGLLVWALSGADLLGSPGFSQLGRTQWAQATGNVYRANPPPYSDAYALDNNQQPANARYGPYVDASKVKVAQNEGTVVAPDFKIPEETRARKALGTLAFAPRREYPMYLDAFGYPVLYWRADPAGRQMADVARGETNTTRGIYHCEDNVQLTDPTLNPNLSLVLNKAGEQHRLAWNKEFRDNLANPSTPLTIASFPRYIWNSAVKARYEPQRADSFLLVSPGADGVYGTSDDVTNFAPNAQ